MLTGLIFQPRPFILFQLSWYLFIMTIDTSPLCLYKVSESTYINILLWVLTTATDEHIYLVRGLLYLYIPTVAASVFSHLYNPPPPSLPPSLSLSCVPVAQHKHHESQHQNLRSLWGAQTRRNQSSWLIVDYHEMLLFSSLTSAFMT